MMVLTDLGAAAAGEEGLGQVRAGVMLGECNRVVNPAHFVVGVRRIPACGFVGMHDGIGIRYRI